MTDAHEIQLIAEIRAEFAKGATPGDVAAVAGLDVVEGALALPGWYAYDDDGSGPDCGAWYDDHNSGRKAAREYVVEGDYQTDRTVWIDVRVCRKAVAADGEVVRVAEALHTITVHPRAPECVRGRGLAHQWESPVKVVGGCAANPGVHGHGGGVIERSVCAHCGCYRVTDTWAQRPDTGEQGMTSVRYEPADERSATWLREQFEGWHCVDEADEVHVEIERGCVVRVQIPADAEGLDPRDVIEAWVDARGLTFDALALRGRMDLGSGDISSDGEGVVFALGGDA